LSEVWFKFDPFDLALTRIDAEALETLPSTLAERLEKARAMLAESKEVNEAAREHVGLGQAMGAPSHRISASSRGRLPHRSLERRRGCCRRRAQSASSKAEAALIVEKRR
jgi:hypothetical protein